MTPIDATTTTAVRARLGAGWTALHSMMHRDGECAACGRTLGDEPVAVSLHQSDSGVLTAAPTHDRCRRADFRRGGPVSVPFPSYKGASAVISAAAPDNRRKISRRRRSTTAPAPQTIPLVIINRSRDVHVGTCEDGIWRSSTQDGAEYDGLRPVPEHPSVDGDPTWGADVHDDGDSVEVSSPSSARYVVPLGPAAARALREVGRVLVIVTDRADVDELISGAIGLHDVAAAEDTLCAVAAVGALPASLALPSAVDAEPGPGRQILGTTGELSAAMLDTECSFRAVLADDDSVLLAPLPWPVLLVEPVRVIRLPHEGSVTGVFELDSALQHGMRLVPASGSPAPPAVRDFTVTRSGTTMSVRSADGTEVASGALDVLPRRWVDAFDAFGGDQLAVVYGPVIGVRPAHPGRDFPEHERLAELLGSREQGKVAWTIARYTART